MHTVYSMKGIGELLGVYADKIKIAPNDIIGFFTQKMIMVVKFTYSCYDLYRLMVRYATFGNLLQNLQLIKVRLVG